MKNKHDLELIAEAYLDSKIDRRFTYNHPDSTENIKNTIGNEPQAPCVIKYLESIKQKYPQEEQTINQWIQKIKEGIYLFDGKPDKATGRKLVKLLDSTAEYWTE